MTRVIHKIEIPRINELVYLEVPLHSTILSAGLQDGVPVVWFEFEEMPPYMEVAGTQRIPHTRGFFVALTGRPFRWREGRFVGTLQRADGIVLHVYTEKVR